MPVAGDLVGRRGRRGNLGVRQRLRRRLSRICQFCRTRYPRPIWRELCERRRLREAKAGRRLRLEATGISAWRRVRWGAGTTVGLRCGLEWAVSARDTIRCWTCFPFRRELIRGG